MGRNPEHEMKQRLRAERALVSSKSEKLSNTRQRRSRMAICSWQRDRLPFPRAAAINLIMLHAPPAYWGTEAITERAMRTWSTFDTDPVDDDALQAWMLELNALDLDSVNDNLDKIVAPTANVGDTIQHGASADNGVLDQSTASTVVGANHLRDVPLDRGDYGQGDMHKRTRTVSAPPKVLARPALYHLFAISEQPDVSEAPATALPGADANAGGQTKDKRGLRKGLNCVKLGIARVVHAACRPFACCSGSGAAAVHG
ncbi:hypothetical protein WJX81_005708 [Elliptochloris bilobata]|uniref:Uncharacterized protein n=1 Tax=Elliptochloris bilobata TaxID=381761 RepID=A0AAW1SJP0_9CHLO